MSSQSDRCLNEERAKELLEWLVRENTCQPYGREKKLAKEIVQLVSCHQGTEYEVLDHSEERASLIVKIKGETDSGGTAFVGHLDTVPCEESDGWDRHPHSAYTEKGILYGRGAADMKGGIAAMLMTMEYLLKRKVILKHSAYFCFSADEEKNGLGAVALAEHPWMQQVGEIVICEPSTEQIGCCEKGALWVALELNGVSAHASRPDLGENALEKAITIYRKLQYAAALVKAEPHPYLGQQSVTLTGLSGGVSTNIVPNHAYMELDIRTVPGGISNEEFLEMLQKEVDGSINILNNRPPLETPETTPMVVRWKKILERHCLNTLCKGLHFYTDASQIVPKTKKPFLILGPGDEKQAHCVNERIEIASVSRMAEVYVDYLQTVERGK